MIKSLYGIFSKEKPAAMVCFGDTNSTLSAAIAAVKLNIPFVHVEAGERNFDAKGNKAHPASIPEETNRNVTDELSSLLLCSTRRAVKNLNAEEIKGDIIFTGDIMYDLYIKSIKKVIKESNILKMLNLKPKSYYFCTVHRAINTDSKARMAGLYNALKNINSTVVIPVHPRTKKALENYNLYSIMQKLDNLVMLEPVGYKDSLMLNYNSSLVLTDSGGVVREAYFSSVPSLMLDDTSEWQDLFESKWSVITGADSDKIIKAVKKLKTPETRPSYFGNGNAVNKTISAIKNWLN
jgi:UDP-N-acetylglucosamine 2-epimerase